MEDHILEKHAVPDKDNWYKCDDCTFQSKEKSLFGKHYKEEHGSKAPNKKLEDENRILKNNFERLEGMYHDSLEEVNKTKSEYEARLILATDNYTVVKTENEVLKERVDILFKLGRSYLDRTATTKNNEISGSIDNERNEERQDDDVIEVIEESQDDIETLQGWAKSKMRGFKRSNPTSNATPKKTPKAKPNVNFSNNKKDEPKSNQTNRDPSSPPNPDPDAILTAPEPASASPDVQTDHDQYQGRYCHYFVNKGRCNHEEMTGFRCKFEHKPAPMCSYGMNCSRPKCMYAHPKIANNGSSIGNRSFLGNRRGFPQMMNPWGVGMINPWMMPQQNQFPANPWNGMEKQQQ